MTRYLSKDVVDRLNRFVPGLVALPDGLSLEEVLSPSFCDNLALGILESSGNRLSVACAYTGEKVAGMVGVAYYRGGFAGVEAELVRLCKYDW